MKIKTPRPPPSAAADPDKSSGPGLGQISQNIETILGFYSRDEQQISASQRFLEAFSATVGRPLYLGGIVLSVALWIGANVIARRAGFAAFDPPPLRDWDCAMFANAQNRPAGSRKLVFR